MRHVANAIAESGDRFGRGLVETEFGGRQLAGAELVLESQDFDVAQLPRGVTELHVEQREPLAAGTVPFRARQRERHLRRHGRREPLDAGEAPDAVVAAPSDRLGQADVGAAGALGHPLSAGPGARRIARGEMRDRPLAGGAEIVAEQLERARGAIAHGERAGVELARRMEQVDQRELVYAREAPMSALVADRDEASLRSHAGVLLPRCVDPHLVRPPPPGVERHVLGFVPAVPDREFVEPASGHGPHLGELGLDLPADVGIDGARQPATQQRVVRPGVGEMRRRLDEEGVAGILRGVGSEGGRHDAVEDNPPAAQLGIRTGSMCRRVGSPTEARIPISSARICIRASLRRMPAARILSLLPSTTEIAVALGLGEQLVGRSHECTVPAGIERLPVVTVPKLDPHAPSAEIDARVKALVRDGLSVYRVDAELARTLAPDVILTQTQCEVCAVTPSDLEAAACDWLAGREGPAPRLVAVAPNTLGDVLDDLVRVAEGCGVPERGAALRAREQARIDAITARVDAVRGGASGRPRPSVAFLEWLDPPMGPGSWIPEVIERAGGRPLLGRSGEHAEWTNLDALAALDPDVLVLAPCGFDLARTRSELAPLTGDSRFQTLRAARNGRVALVDAFLHMSRPGPRIAESLEILAEILHPGAPEIAFGWHGRGWAKLPT